MNTNARKPPSASQLRLVQLWLYGIALLVSLMVVVGGATRLTDSGLSITEWQLITGVIPPMSDAQWTVAFKKYQEIPEFSIINSAMTLAEFKIIYWWEWAHRFLGRFVGFAFALPMLFFWVRGYLTSALKPKLLLILVLGALQGGMGWYMVQSGLVENVDVSQYRLAAHLSLAVVLYGFVFWVALSLREWRPEEEFDGHFVLEGGIVLAVLVFLQIVAGAFVAGLDAGQGYNTWPLMDGALVPDGLMSMTPVWLNFFENALTVQFTHRVVAYLIVLLALAYCLGLLKNAKQGPLAISARLILLVVIIQVVLGIATLLTVVNIALALCHQIGALILLALTLNHIHMVLRVRACGLTALPDGG